MTDKYNRVRTHKETANKNKLHLHYPRIHKKTIINSNINVTAATKQTMNT